MRTSPVITGRLQDLTRKRLLDDAIPIPRENSPVLGLDGVPLQYSYLRRRAERLPEFSEAVARIRDENSTLVTYGARSIELLLDQPLRSIELPEEHIVISSFSGDEGIHIMRSNWPVVRNPDRTIREIGVGDLDELPYPAAIAALTAELRRMADLSKFRPWKGFRVALLVGPRIERETPGLTQMLVVAAAVAGAETELVPEGDLNLEDDDCLNRLSKFVNMERHQMIISVTGSDERWINFIKRSFKERVPWLKLSGYDAALAVEQIDAAISNAAKSAFAYPLFAWGERALARISEYEGEAFQLSRRARKTLLSNPYPDVERMLEHVERLAKCAHKWHEEDLPFGRFQDWVLENFELNVALQDGRLGSGWTVEYQMKDSAVLEIDAQPHVKVDDHTDVTHCGRIYFGMHTANKVIVVRQVGIHPESR